VKIVYSDEHALHSPGLEFDGAAQVLGPHPEVPARAQMILAALSRAGCGPVVSPRAPRPEELEAVHAPELLGFLEEFCSRGSGREEVAADAFALHGWQVTGKPGSRRRTPCAGPRGITRDAAFSAATAT